MVLKRRKATSSPSGSRPRRLGSLSIDGLKGRERRTGGMKGWKDGRMAGRKEEKDEKDEKEGKKERKGKQERKRRVKGRGGGK